MKQSFFHTPEFLSLPIFGLSISQTSIRIAKMTRHTSGKIPNITDEIRIEESCTFFNKPEEYTECPVLKNALIQIKNKHKIKFVQLAIPEEYTYVFTVSFPDSDVNLIPDFIKNNIDQHIPLSNEEVFFDYKILKNKSTRGNIPVVVTAIPKIIIEKYTQIISSAGMLVVACEPETHAIARAVIDFGDSNPYIIINIEEQATNISIVEDNYVQYTQTLPLTNKDVTSKLDKEHAQLIKESLSKVIIYWFTSKDNSIKHSKIENIILTGYDVNNSDLISFLESNLFVNVTYANVWKNCFNLGEYIPNISKSESLKYATCVGLSMFKVK
jgi:Tfp pilus assembly PilM family ATPase